MKQFMIILDLTSKRLSNKFKNIQAKRDKIFMSKPKLIKPNINKKLIHLLLDSKLHLSLQVLVKINKKILE